MSETQLDAFCAGGSSPPNSACDSVALATLSFAGTKRGIVPKRRFQKGTFVKRGDNWVGMWRVDTLQPDGTTKREQRSQTFIGLSESKGCRRVKAVGEWREHAAVSLKPSTRRSVESHLRRHILPLLGDWKARVDSKRFALSRRSLF
jgi:hypothetical protein